MKIKKKLKEFFALERNIAIVCLSNLLWASNGLYREFIPKFYESLGASLLIVGVLFSLKDVVYTISSFIGGHLSDRYGRKRTWIVAAFIGNFLLLGYIFAPNWLFLFPLITLIYFFIPMEDVSGSTLIAESLPKSKRATGFSSVYLSGMVTSILFVAAGGWIVQQYSMLPGVRLAVSISFLLCLVANTILLLFSKETLKKRIIKPIEFNISKSINFLIKLPKQIKSVFLFVSLLNFASSVTIAYWIFYALDVISISPLEWGLLGSLMFAFTSLFIFAGGKLSDKYGRKTVMLISAFGYFVVPILFILSKNFFHLVFVYSLMGFAAIGYSSIMPYVADHTDYRKRARAIGLTNSIIIMSGIAGPVVGAFLYNLLPQYPFIFSSLIYLASFFIGLKYLS